MAEDQLDYEIDLSFLLSWWREIAVFTVLCIVAAVAVTALMPRIYSAQARVLVLRRRTDVNLDSSLSITSADDLPAGGPGSQTYRDLASSPAIGPQVAEKLMDSGFGDSANPAALASGVEVENASGSDLLLISYRNADPARAAAIATAWAEVYVDYVNRLYNEPSADYQLVVNQLGQTQLEYQTAQTALEALVKNDQTAELQRLVDEKTNLIDRLQSDRDLALTTLYDESWNGDIAASFVDAATSVRIYRPDQPPCERHFVTTPAADPESEDVVEVVQRDCPPVFSMAIEERLAALQGDEQLLQQYHRQLADVTTMRDQLAGGGDAASSTLSVALLKAQLLDVERGLPAELSLQLPASSQDSTVQLADLDALKAVLTDAISRLKASVDEQTQSISQVSYGMDLVDQTNDPVTLRLTGLQTEVQDLQSQIEAQTSKKEQLTLTRDLAWDSYNTLARKEAELRIANDLPASEVRFAAPAATPTHPVSPKTNLILAAGAAGGLVFAVLAAFLLHFLGQEPVFGRRGGKTPL